MKPGFLVDGVTEQRFVQSVCSNRPVKLINCNGSKVSVEAIAKRVASLIRLWGGKCFPVVVLIDRETRLEAADFLCQSLVDAIREEGIQDQLIVGVADRMVENWMLADPALWPGMPDSENVDGSHGASVLKRLSSYDKAANGPGILAASRASEIRRRSASFLAFSELLAPLRCNWLRK